MYSLTSLERTAFAFLWRVWWDGVFETNSQKNPSIKAIFSPLIKTAVTT